MPRLSARLVAVMKRVDQALMPDTCNITGVTGNPPTEHGPSSPIASNVPCRLRVMSPEDYPQHLIMPNMKPLYEATFPVGTTLKQEWQIIHSGNTYKILQVLDDGTPNVDVRATLMRLT